MIRVINKLGMFVVKNSFCLIKTHTMLFEVGETVVYPHHGAATIIEVKERVIKGETKKYLKLNVTQGDLVIEVPADQIVAVPDKVQRPLPGFGLSVRSRDRIHQNVAVCVDVICDCISETGEHARRNSVSAFTAEVLVNNAGYNTMRKEEKP